MQQVKTTVTLPVKKENNIDWSKPMYVMSKDGCIVKTNGKYNWLTFSGTYIGDDDDYKNDDICSDCWDKDAFTPCPPGTKILIEIE